MIRIAALAVCLGTILCFGQSGNALERLRALNLPAIEGSVPAVYSPSAKARAELYRSALERAHTWFEAQLDIHVPATLAVLDEQDWLRATSVPYPMPNAKAGLVTIPARMEDFPGFANMGIDAVILTETISFHEMGHLFASQLGIRAGNSWFNELVANIFAQEYIGGHQPLLKAYLPAPSRDPETPRYTSLADLDYLQFDGVTFSNYAWFQFRLNQLAFLMAQKQDLRQIVQQLKINFPAGQRDALPFGEVVRRLETIVTGIGDAFGSLAKPSTIAKNRELACSDAGPGDGASTYLVIVNRRSSELVVTQSKKPPIHVASDQWQRLSVGVGEQVKLANGGCIVASNEPSLVVLERP